VRLHAGVPAVHVHGLERAALPAASWLTIQDTDVGADREEERVLAVDSKAPQDEARVLLHLHVVRALRRGRGLLCSIARTSRPCALARAISSVVTAERSWVRAEDSALCTRLARSWGAPVAAAVTGQ
jgi:hypothetical protein